jgi:hypothetical protein
MEESPLPRGRIKVPENVVHRSFQEETVLLNLDTGQYHGLNGTAGMMLKALEETGDAERAAEIVAGEFDVELERVRADLADLCSALLERGLVVIE